MNTFDPLFWTWNDLALGCRVNRQARSWLRIRCLYESHGSWYQIAWLKTAGGRSQDFGMALGPRCSKSPWSSWWPVDMACRGSTPCRLPGLDTAIETKMQALGPRDVRSLNKHHVKFDARGIAISCYISTRPRFGRDGLGKQSAGE